MLHTLHFKLWRCVHQSRQRLLNRVLVCLQLGSHFLTWWILTTGQCDSHWRFPAVFRWRSPSTSWKSEQWTPIQNTRWCAYVFFFFFTAVRIFTAVWSIIFDKLSCPCTGCHRHRQDHLLAETTDPGPAGSHGQPHQLRPLPSLQQLHLCVSISEHTCLRRRNYALCCCVCVCLFVCVCVCVHACMRACVHAEEWRQVGRR